MSGLALDVQQRLVGPNIFVTRGHQEPRSWRKVEELRHLRAPLHKVLCVQRLEEVRVSTQFARPDVPAGRPRAWRMPEAVNWPVPGVIQQRCRDTQLGPVIAHL